METKFVSSSPNILQPKRVNPQDHLRLAPSGPNGCLKGHQNQAINPPNSCKDKVLNSSAGKKAPVSMAKRNARERNRVKQVNQGFQILKQHIPDTYRLKKMSKVDTLRCALDYIRSLEEYLDDGGNGPESATSTSISTSPFQISYENHGKSIIFDEDDSELLAEDEEQGMSFDIDCSQNSDDSTSNTAHQQQLYLNFATSDRERLAALLLPNLPKGSSNGPNSQENGQQTVTSNK